MIETLYTLLGLYALASLFVVYETEQRKKCNFECTCISKPLEYCHEHGA